MPRGDPLDGEARKMRAGGETAHCGIATLAGWLDVSFGDQAMGGRRRLGYEQAIW